MKQSDEKGRIGIDTVEWYDFIGLLADALPSLHLGGASATGDLLAMLRPGPDDLVLDIGCGAGLTSCKIAAEHGSRVVGIDISDIMVSKARERARRQRVEERVEFRVADAFRLPFDDGSFDLALFESVLTPLPGCKLDALRETIRVVRPGGLVGANETIFFASAPAELLELAEEHPAIHGMFTPEGLRGLFEESGLSVVEASEVRSSEAQSAVREMGVTGILSFMVRSYWKILGRLLTDPNYRRAQRIDDRISKILREHGGYMLIVGQRTPSTESTLNSTSE